MNRMTGNGSINLGRRAYGTAGRRTAPGGAPAVFGGSVDLLEEMPCKPMVTGANRTWKPRPGRIYNFPIPRAAEEK